MAVKERAVTVELNSFFSYSTENTAASQWLGEGLRQRGTASSNKLPDGSWWVSRVLVQPSTMTGKGIGGKLLDLVIEEIKKQGGGTVVVCPGGYENNYKKQSNFYRKHGFVGDQEMRLVLS